jgi:hypothetical protein
MYKIDPNESFGFLINCEVSQICYGLYDILLNLSNNVSISIESKLRLHHGESVLEIEPGQFNNASDLNKLIGCTISEANIIGDKELRIRFSSGSELALLDTKEHFESFSISSPKGDIIV